VDRLKSHKSAAKKLLANNRRRLRLAAFFAGVSLIVAGCSHHNQSTQVPAPTPIPTAPNSPAVPPPANKAPSPAGTPSGPPPAAELQPAIPGQYVEEGVASWYGVPFNGHRTSNGEIYDMHQMTAAHRTLPFNAYVRVTNLNNGMQTEVRINDRGPFVADRIIDLSLSAAQAIQMIGTGTARVRLEVISGPNPQTGFFGVQVGAFLVEANADKFRDQLSTRYSPVIVVPYDSPNGMYYRVRVGRVPSEDAAQQLATQLQTTDKLTTFVVRLDN
jgi:rare lipoprotein A